MGPRAWAFIVAGIRLRGLRSTRQGHRLVAAAFLDFNPFFSGTRLGDLEWSLAPARPNPPLSHRLWRATLPQARAQPSDRRGTGSVGLPAVPPLGLGLDGIRPLGLLERIAIRPGSSGTRYRTNRRLRRGMGTALDSGGIEVFARGHPKAQPTPCPTRPSRLEQAEQVTPMTMSTTSDTSADVTGSAGA